MGDFARLLLRAPRRRLDADEALLASAISFRRVLAGAGFVARSPAALYYAATAAISADVPMIACRFVAMICHAFRARPDAYYHSAPYGGPHTTPASFGVTNATLQAESGCPTGMPTILAVGRSPCPQMKWRASAPAHLFASGSDDPPPGAATCAQHGTPRSPDRTSPDCARCIDSQSQQQYASLRRPHLPLHRNLITVDAGGQYRRGRRSSSHR
jgi:hypothetical protein